VKVFLGKKKTTAEMKTKRTIQRISETKSWFFESINKFDKCTTKLIKRKKKKSSRKQITGWVLVAHACNPSYSATLISSEIRRIVVRIQLQANSL
jgi:hypothetical protein